METATPPPTAGSTGSQEQSRHQQVPQVPVFVQVHWASSEVLGGTLFALGDTAGNKAPSMLLGSRGHVSTARRKK